MRLQSSVRLTPAPRDSHLHPPARSFVVAEGWSPADDHFDDLACLQEAPPGKVCCGCLEFDKGWPGPSLSSNERREKGLPSGFVAYTPPPAEEEAAGEVGDVAVVDTVRAARRAGLCFVSFPPSITRLLSSCPLISSHHFVGLRAASDARFDGAGTAGGKRGERGDNVEEETQEEEEGQDEGEEVGAVGMKRRRDGRRCAAEARATTHPPPAAAAPPPRRLPLLRLPPPRQRRRTAHSFFVVASLLFVRRRNEERQDRP